MSGLRPVDETIDALLALVRPVADVETRALDAARGLCLAEDVVSQVNVPPADNSAMDGYVFRYGDVESGAWLPVSARIAAGQVGQSLASGTLARIFTGAPVPDDADTVVMQEDTEDRDGEVRITAMPDKGANVRQRGQDIQQDSIVARAGSKLTPALLGLIASVGVASIQVRRPLRIAMMSTGDELVEPGAVAGPGSIYNSNRYALAALLRSCGFEVEDLGIVIDTAEATETALLRAAESADCIITTGGVSVGEEDHVKAAVEKLGRIELWKLAIKPGKPLAFGEVNGVPFFGLPGNPVSTFVTFLIVARPYLLATQGFADFHYPTFFATAGFRFKGGSRREYLRIRLTRSVDGDLMAEMFGNQGSGVMSSVAWADALAEVEIGQQVEPGDRLRIYPLDLL